MVRPALPLVLSLWVLPVLLPQALAGPAAHAPGQARAAQVRQNDNPAPGKSGQSQGAGKMVAAGKTAPAPRRGDDPVTACLKTLRGWRVASPDEISTLRSARLMTAPGCKTGGGLDWSGRAALAGNAMLARFFEGRGLPLQAVVGVIVRDSGEAAIIIAK